MAQGCPPVPPPPSSCAPPPPPQPGPPASADGSGGSRKQRPPPPPPLPKRKQPDKEFCAQVAADSSASYTKPPGWTVAGGGKHPKGWPLRVPLPQCATLNRPADRTNTGVYIQTAVTGDVAAFITEGSQAVAAYAGLRGGTQRMRIDTASLEAFGFPAFAAGTAAIVAGVQQQLPCLKVEALFDVMVTGVAPMNHGQTTNHNDPYWANRAKVGVYFYHLPAGATAADYRRPPSLPPAPHPHPPRA